MSGELYYSMHGARRCIERGISETIIMRALERGKLAETCGKNRVYEYGRLRVIVRSDKDGDEVVTAYRLARSNPKRVAKERRQAKQETQRKYFRGKK